MHPGIYGMLEEWEDGDQEINMDFLLPTGIFLKFPVSRNDTIKHIKEVKKIFEICAFFRSGLCFSSLIAQCSSQDASAASNAYSIHFKRKRFDCLPQSNNIPTLFFGSFWKINLWLYSSSAEQDGCASSAAIHTVLYSNAFLGTFKEEQNIQCLFHLNL